VWHSIVFTMMTRNQDDQCHPVEDWLDMIRMITVACYTAAIARNAQKEVLCADCRDSLVATMLQFRRVTWDSLAGLFALTQWQS
jgi:hypothetical protein